MKQRANRRDFLKAAAATAVACPYLIPESALGAGDRASPSNHIVMGGIGIGDQGSGDQGAYLGRGDVQYVAVCDVEANHRNAARDRVYGRYQNRDCRPTPTSAICWPALISMPSTAPRPTTGIPWW